MKQGMVVWTLTHTKLYIIIHNYFHSGQKGLENLGDLVSVAYHQHCFLY